MNKCERICASGVSRMRKSHWILEDMRLLRKFVPRKFSIPAQPDKGQGCNFRKMTIMAISQTKRN